MKIRRLFALLLTLAMLLTMLLAPTALASEVEIEDEEEFGAVSKATEESVLEETGDGDGIDLSEISSDYTREGSSSEEKTNEGNAENEYVALIGEQGYASLAEALVAVTENGSITLCADIEGNFTTDKSFTLVLGSHTLTVNAAEGIQTTDGAELTITGGTITSSKDDIISANGGKITLGEGLKVKGTSSVIYAYNGGNVTIDGAEVIAENSPYAVAFATGSGSSINVESGSLTSTGTDVVTIMIKGGASAKINGGSVSNDASTTIAASGKDSTITINGGEVSTTSAFVAGYAKGEGKIVVTGGAVTSEYWITLSAIKWDTSVGGTVEIRGGTVNKAVGAYEDAASTVIMSGGTVGDENSWGVYVTNGASAEISDGTVKGYASTPSGGSGIVKITGGDYTWSGASNYITTESDKVLRKNDDGTFSVVDKVTVTFKVGDETVDTQEIPSGGKVKEPDEQPIKEDASFAGWYDGENWFDIENDTIEEDTTLVGKWCYTITWLDGNGDELTTEDYVEGSLPYYDNEKQPTKTATAEYSYTFNEKWTPEIVEVTEAATYTALFDETPNPYTITFDTDGGSAVAAIKQNYGSTVAAPANPTKTGYTFAGWDKDIPKTMPAENITIKAKWTAKQTAAPTVKPTAAPTATQTAAPTAKPTAAPTAKPTAAPTAKPTAAPTAKPTSAPTTAPTVVPAAEPVVEPAATPEPAKGPTPVSGSVNIELMARLRASGKNTLKFNWVKLKQAQGYDVFFGANGEFTLVRSQGVKKSRSIKFAGLNPNSLYQAYVMAWVMDGDNKTYIACSPMTYAYTGNGTATVTNSKSVSAKPSKLTLRVGTSGTLAATVKGEKKNLAIADNEGLVRYYSQNGSVATVSADGIVTATGVGSCKIWVVSANGAYKGIKVTVLDGPKKVKFAKSSYRLAIGGAMYLGEKMKFTPAGVDSIGYSWESSNPAVATVDANGIVTAIGAGKTKITVTTANGRKARVTIRVK